MIGYRLATLQSPAGPRAVAIIGDGAYDAAQLTGDDRHMSVHAILEDWDRAHAKLDAASRDPKGTGIAVDLAAMLAPIPTPSVIYCAGANYRDHAEEMSSLAGKPPEDPRANGAQPWFFLKSPHSVVAPGATVDVTHYGKCIDWEAELVAVIGRKARNVSVTEALDFVAGYTCGNDLSARDQFFRSSLPDVSPFRADWTRHKSFEDACPIGPWIVPAAYVRNPADLSIRLWVNDSLKQNSNSGQMIFSVAEQIAALSRDITLHPGDLVMTGTPAGVGMARQEFLKRGDVVRMEIGDIGIIENVIQ